eukprot:m.21437 g.21437  ORF g.21437 m.21437 type:complete len:350 (+) comp11141_c0_seq1:109-1158(+)
MLLPPYAAHLVLAIVLLMVMMLYLSNPQATLARVDTGSGHVQANSGLHLNLTGQVSTAALSLTTSQQMHVLIYVATPSKALKQSLRTLFRSLCQHHAPQDIHLHLACDPLGCDLCIQDGLTEVFNTTLHPLEAMAAAGKDMLGTVLPFFDINPESHYAKDLFVLSLVLHKLLPLQSHLLLLDADLKAAGPLWPLWQQLTEFTVDQSFGLSFEQQPVYRHVFAAHRQQHPNTTLGSPPASGFPGFNSGVLLIHLDHLRHNTDYAALFTASTMHELATAYHFQGHLGDQDFYTLLYVLHPELFAILPCGYNRQLCTWWQKHPVYTDVFEAYHHCGDSVLVWHANCNSQFPI